METLNDNNNDNLDLVDQLISMTNNIIDRNMAINILSLVEGDILEAVNMVMIDQTAFIESNEITLIDQTLINETTNISSFQPPLLTSKPYINIEQENHLKNIKLLLLDIENSKSFKLESSLNNVHIHLFYQNKNNEYNKLSLDSFYSLGRCYCYDSHSFVLNNLRSTNNINKYKQNESLSYLSFGSGCLDLDMDNLENLLNILPLNIKKLKIILIDTVYKNICDEFSNDLLLNEDNLLSNSTTFKSIQQRNQSGEEFYSSQYNYNCYPNGFDTCGKTKRNISNSIFVNLKKSHDVPIFEYITRIWLKLQKKKPNDTYKELEIEIVISTEIQKNEIVDIFLLENWDWCAYDLKCKYKIGKYSYHEVLHQICNHHINPVNGIVIGNRLRNKINMNAIGCILFKDMKFNIQYAEDQNIFKLNGFRDLWQDVVDNIIWKPEIHDDLFNLIDKAGNFMVLSNLVCYDITEEVTPIVSIYLTYIYNIHNIILDDNTKLSEYTNTLSEHHSNLWISKEEMEEYEIKKNKIEEDIENKRRESWIIWRIRQKENGRCLFLN